MNDVEVRAIPESNGFRAEYRKLHVSGWWPVIIDNVVQLYETEEKAKIAAYEALHRYLFGVIRRDGEKAKATAEAEFAKVFPGKGRRPYEVVRR